jgi:hypothetical protein
MRMWENFILKVVELDTWEIWLSVDYRWVEKTISLTEMDAAIKMCSK